MMSKVESSDVYMFSAVVTTVFMIAFVFVYGIYSTSHSEQMRIETERMAIEKGLVQDDQGHWVAKDKER